MILRITSFRELDGRKLMGIYREGNEENVPYFFPEETDMARGLAKAEEGFLEYLRTDFFAKPGNACWILTQGETWISALRLYPVGEREFYLEALETHPDYRRQGYGSTLLKAVLEELKKDGAFRIRDCVSKRNQPSIGTHLKCSFRILPGACVNLLTDETEEGSWAMAYDYEPK